MSNYLSTLLGYHLSAKSVIQGTIRAQVHDYWHGHINDVDFTDLPNTPDSVSATQQLTIANKLGHTIIDCLDPRYPKLLLEIDDFPLVLYCRGDLVRLDDPLKIAIVGTRKPTYDAVKMCDAATKYLAHWPYTVVSGMAIGVDALAHRGALAYSCPTIAVLASPVDTMTPKHNTELGKKIIAANGLIVSETPYHTRMSAFHFVKRNRIVSGMCQQVFIIEAAINSGSMATAKHSIDQNRDLFVMPGSISNPVATGTNALLLQGAAPVTKAEDLFVEKVAESTIPPARQAHPIIQILLDELTLEIDQLALRLNLPFGLILSELTMLEVEGLISLMDNRVQLKVNS